MLFHLSFYYYLYETLSEIAFSALPNEKEIHYQANSYHLLEEKNEPIFMVSIYENGIKEEFSKTFKNYENKKNDPDYLSFEYGEDQEDFDVSLGKPVSHFKFWRIQK